MKRPNELLVESAAIASVMIMLTLGGSVATTTIPPSFLPLQNPGAVNVQYDLSGLALYYNTTLTLIGSGQFVNASFLLSTFKFVNIPSNVNGTALAANADLAAVNSTVPRAMKAFSLAKSAIQENELFNASALVKEGCSFAANANRSMADFSGAQSLLFRGESVPTDRYASGLSLTLSQIRSLQGLCDELSKQLPGPGVSLVFLISSPQRAVETGGSVRLNGNLTKSGTGIAAAKVYFYLNGTYFGTIVSNAKGNIVGILEIPFVYSHSAAIQALVSSNATPGSGGALSNIIYLTVLFNQTSIVVGDPPSYLPGASFSVHGNLTTTNGTPLPSAPVTITYLRDSVATTTNGFGRFEAQFTVPSNATDGTYYIYARFSPKGVYGPSFNFTSIEVYHLHLKLSLSVPWLSWAGFSTSVRGTATANGTAVEGVPITLYSPWGSISARTDQSGRFGLDVPVSPFEFAFSKNVTVSASPRMGYIAGSTSVVPLGLFNVLLIILPAALIGAVGYEANSLGAFEGIRTRFRGPPEPKSALLKEMEKHYVEALTPPEGPEELYIHRRAVALASVRFLITFKPSMTIREMLLLVKTKEGGEAYVSFSKILLATEDFLYGRKYDSSRTEEARGELAALEEAWM